MELKKLKKTFCRFLFVSAAALLFTQVPSFAYQLDAENHVLNISPSTTPAATTSDLRSAMAYLTNRSDQDTTWTMKFAPGKYVLTAQVSAPGLKNTVLSSDPQAPAQLIKVAGWDSATSAEYLLSFRMASKVKLVGFEFYGQTNFVSGPNPYWPDQGVYFGSCNMIRVDSNKFNNFGNAALRVVTDTHDPVMGVNSFNTTVTNNTFNNIYQTATTSIDRDHGGTANSTWSNNKFYNVRGSIKFASRTAGAQNIQFLNNQVNGGDHYGLEIDNYSNFTIQGNTFQNLKAFAMTIYTNGSGADMVNTFPWGDNFTISNNTISNVGYGISYNHRPYWDGTQNIPKNLVIDSNTISGVTSTDTYTPAISVNGGLVDGLKVTNNKMSNITNKKYITVQAGSTNVSILNNAVNGTAFGPQSATAAK